MTQRKGARPARLTVSGDCAITRSGEFSGSGTTIAEGADHGLGNALDVSAEERLRRVAALDLEPIVYKLMYPEPGETGLFIRRWPARTRTSPCTGAF